MIKRIALLSLEFSEYILHRIQVFSSTFVPIDPIPIKKSTTKKIACYERFSKIATWKSWSDDHFGHGDRHFWGHRPPPWSMQPLSRRDANSLFLSRNLGHAAATVSCFRCYRLLRTYVPYIHQKRCHDIDRKSLFHSFNSLHLENIAFFSLGFINPIPQNTFLYCKREKLDTSLETNFHANVPFQIFIFLKYL